MERTDAAYPLPAQAGKISLLERVQGGAALVDRDDDRALRHCSGGRADSECGDARGISPSRYQSAGALGPLRPGRYCHGRCDSSLDRSLPDWLRLSRCGAPRNESRRVDISRNCTDARISRSRLYRLLRDAGAVAVRLPAVWNEGRGAVQLLPQLQMQSASLLSTVQARSARHRQILQLLRPESRQPSSNDYSGGSAGRIRTWLSISLVSPIRVGAAFMVSRWHHIRPCGPQVDRPLLVPACKRGEFPDPLPGCVQRVGP